MNPSILLVEDDPASRRLVSFLLENEGLPTVACEDAISARAQMARETPSIVVLDIMLPGEDGIAFAKHVRTQQQFNHVPLIAFSARTHSIDRYEALKAGFVNYFAKPIDPMEFVLTIKSLLNLVDGTASHDALGVGPENFRLIPEKLMVIVDGVEKPITRREVDVLKYLMERPGQVFSADQLSEAVLESGSGRERSVDAVHAHIRNLRNKLEAVPKQPVRILTMGRRGYYFAS